MRTVRLGARTSSVSTRARRRLMTTVVLATLIAFGTGGCLLVPFPVPVGGGGHGHHRR